MNNSYGAACVTVNRNRLKTYTGTHTFQTQVYLQNGQEFELELFNPSTITKLAKISLNGKDISQSGLVIKPGQRVYLERFLDVAKRFKFETYTVDGSTEAQQAIASNGEVVVTFYDEEVPKPVYVNNWEEQVKYRSAPEGIRFSNQLFASSGMMKVASLCQSTTTTSTVTTDAIETGRIEKGSSSDQRFKSYDGKFNYWSCNTVTIKMLPFNSKPLEVDDLAQYCTICGTKNKKGNYKFCPKCGTKF